MKIMGNQSLTAQQLYDRNTGMSTPQNPNDRNADGLIDNSNESIQGPDSAITV